MSEQGTQRAITRAALMALIGVPLASIAGVLSLFSNLDPHNWPSPEKHGSAAFRAHNWGLVAALDFGTVFALVCGVIAAPWERVFQRRREPRPPPRRSSFTLEEPPMPDPEIPPEALQPSGRTPESLPNMGENPDKADPEKDRGDGALPTGEELPEVKNPIPPG